ncbi:restriction endonuclease subunit S [Streptomyces griseoviridis]|uniref:restriction endonuclease subunit S n=1 Tax=Streptomyces TaxID=1883 RepID=UPI0024752113|nr:restriction endonuclease subunit S [Streptomyces sp. MAA16]MDH6700310.1 restriction endonuclease S subunit [Streptomyces sp. MAA16]
MGGEWPVGWTRMTLADTGKWLSGGTPSTANAEYWDGDIPWISAASLKTFRIAKSDRGLTELGARSGSRLVDAGAVLFVVRGMSLKSEFRIGVAGRRVAFGQDCKAIIAADGIDPVFLAHAIQARTSQILSMVEETSHGTGRLDTERLQEIEIGIPSVSEQQRIVAAHAVIERRIAALERETQKRASVLEALVAARLHRYSGISGTLRQVSESIDAGITLGPQRTPRGNVAEYLRVANVRKGVIDVADLAEMEEEAKDRPRYELVVGDALVVEGHANPEEIGRCAVVGPKESGLLYQNHLFRVRFSQVIPEFGMLWMNSETVRSYWKTRCATSSGLYTVNREMLADVPFPKVRRSEQDELLRVWRSGLCIIRQMWLRVEKLRVVQHGIMEDLLAGDFCGREVCESLR